MSTLVFVSMLPNYVRDRRSYDYCNLIIYLCAEGRKSEAIVYTLTRATIYTIRSIFYAGK